MLKILGSVRWLLGAMLLLQSCWIAFCKMYSGDDVITPQIVLLLNVTYYGAIVAIAVVAAAAAVAIVLLVLGRDSSVILVVYDYIAGN